jgi:hypothetical protein
MRIGGMSSQAYSNNCLIVFIERNSRSGVVGKAMKS